MPGGRPRGPKKEGVNTRVLPSTKAALLRLALERHGSPRALGRVVDEAVEALLGEEERYQELVEELVRERQASDDLRRAASGLARERESLRRQVAELRARRRAARARY